MHTLSSEDRQKKREKKDEGSLARKSCIILRTGSVHSLRHQVCQRGGNASCKKKEYEGEAFNTGGGGGGVKYPLKPKKKKQCKKLLRSSKN